MNDRTFNPRRIARAGLLVAWASFFVYLWATGEQARYLGPRTLWVVPFGAITLSIAALAHLPVLRGPRVEPLRRSELLSLVVALLPIAIVIMAPAPELGSLAASRKSGTTGLVSAAVFAPPAAGERQISFIDIYYAGISEEYAASAGIAEGRELELTGFVTHEAGGTFTLTRFYISCCAADAIPYSVGIDAEDRDYADDTWLTVSGTLVRDGDEYLLEAGTIEEIETPETPYLS